MQSVDINVCRQLFEEWSGEPCLDFKILSANGSNRQYCRVSGLSKSCIGAVNEDVRENEAFFYYGNVFSQNGLYVPTIYAISQDRRCYIQQDLGDVTLYEWVNQQRENNNWDAIKVRYQEVLSNLIDFQLLGTQLEFSNSYPRDAFDKQSMQWDLNYFKYYYLKLTHASFDEQLLENDYITLMDYLLDEDTGGFMYRDFQSRNIMIHKDMLWYIDFQGGRRGAYQYDVASLLYSAKSNLPNYLRESLLDYYIDRLATRKNIDKESFRNKFFGYVLLRILQALGAYGYRGYFERKSYFLSSIPFALGNLRDLLSNHPLPISIPHLLNVLHQITNVADDCQTKSNLKVLVTSFSYRRGLPFDDSGNGGGFVFDCRSLHNPGRYDEYKSKTGLNEEVKDFLKKESGVDVFLSNAQELVKQSVDKYIQRNFTNLMVSFGCTGGQHRSVYCAERMAEWLKNRYPHIAVEVQHRERENWPQ